VDECEPLLRVHFLRLIVDEGRGLHSSTIRLNVSTFCGTRWVRAFPPSLLDNSTRRGVTNTAQVELKSGRV